MSNYIKPKVGIITSTKKINLEIINMLNTNLIVKLTTVLCVAVRCCVAICLSLFEINIHVIFISCRFTQFEHFNTVTFDFFGMYCLKTILPLNFTMTSSTAKHSEGFKILKISSLEFQTCPVTSTVCHLFCQLHSFIFCEM
jgi:hypothetical protein